MVTCLWTPAGAVCCDGLGPGWSGRVARKPPLGEAPPAPGPVALIATSGPATDDPFEGSGPIPRDRVYREQRAAIGLLAMYRAGVGSAGPVELAQVERYLQRTAHPPPVPRPYAADWVGTLDAPKSGTYRFKLDASGPASLWLDDQPVLQGVSANAVTGRIRASVRQSNHANAEFIKDAQQVQIVAERFNAFHRNHESDSF